MPTTPFTIAIPQDDLDGLQRRLAATRWPDAMDGAGWDYGTDPDWLRGVVDHWQRRYDWRAQEARLNAYPQVASEVDGVRIHAVHQPGTGPHSIPLLILHGWPSTFVQFLDVIPGLADPASHGGDPSDGFHVVAASLPGYGFSGTTTDRPMSLRGMGDLLHRFMTEELGYQRYAIRASDIGAGVMTQMALAYPEAIIGLHLSGTYVPYVPDDLSDEERQFIEENERWSQAEGAYGHQHATKPQTLAYGLNDSLVGLAAWILEKFHAWSDGDIDELYDRDALLTNVSVYWFTRTLNSSIRAYRDGFGEDALMGIPDVPTAHLIGNDDTSRVPVAWQRRLYRTDRVTQAEHGGHFLEWEQPGIVIDDLRVFFRDMRS